MKKNVLIVAAIAFSLAPLIAAASGPGDSAGQYPQRSYNGGRPGQGPQRMGGARNFDEVKAHIQQRIRERQAELSKVATCIDQASSFQSLRACMPSRGRGKRRGGARMGGQRQGAFRGPGG